MSMKRKLLRAIAHRRMKNAGLVKVNKKMHVVHPGMREPIRLPSFFSDHWREYTK